MLPTYSALTDFPERGLAAKKILSISVINGVFRGTLKISELRMSSDSLQLALRKVFSPTNFTNLHELSPDDGGVKSEKAEFSEGLGETLWEISKLENRQIAKFS